MIGLLQGESRLVEAGWLLLRMVAICALTSDGVAIGMGRIESIVIVDLDKTDTLGSFLETGGRITKELCGLLLRT